MRILSVETSCDETSVAVVEKTPQNRVRVYSNITASSAILHGTTGGVIPENAAREQIKYILPVTTQALLESRNNTVPDDQTERFEQAQKILKEEIDALAVTFGPGLIGSLLVGVETVKTLSYVFSKPIIPVNHLLGHVYANFLVDSIETTNNVQNKPDPTTCFPFIGLITSGAHTDLLLFKNHTEYEFLGGTRDDAAGEAMDKVARMLGLSYPGGPKIEKLAKLVTESRFRFKSPLLGSADFDFSFSGLKTEVMRTVQALKNPDEKIKAEICFSIQQAIVKVLVEKTIQAAEQFQVKTILLGGGVSANILLRGTLKQKAEEQLGIKNIFFPKLSYCMDNAAMIGSWASFERTPVSWREIHANPQLYFV